MRPDADRYSSELLRPEVRVFAPRSAAQTLVALAAAALLGSFLWVEVYDLDVWWQIAIGREILSSGAIPTLDHWSVLGAGRSYHDSHWLFQIALAAAYQSAGWIGVQTLVAALWSVVLNASWRLARGRLAPLGSALFVVASGLACIERFLPRPELATYAGLAMFLLWFDAGRTHRSVDLAKLAVVQALWTNSHGLFVLGPLVALTHCVAAMIHRKDRAHALRQRAPALLVTGAATLASPHGIYAWKYAMLLAREAGQSAAELVGSLGEMTSPFAAAARSSPAMWIFYLLLALAAVAGARKLARRELDAGLMLGIGGAALALTGRRNVVLFALLSAPLLADLFDSIPRSNRLARPAVPAVVASLLLAATAFPLSGVYYRWMEIPARFGLGVTPSFFPHALAPRLAAGELGRGLLASNTLGGFVAFHGAPRTLPLTDGRWEIYDPPTLNNVLTDTRQPQRWRQIATRFDLDGILLAHTSPEAAAILPEIAEDPAWRLAYLDAAASLWLTGSSDEGPSPDPLRSSALESIHRPEDGILLSVFAAHAGAEEFEQEVLERTLEFGVRRAWLLERLGPLQIEAERFDKAESTFRTLLALDPRHETALNELAFLAARRGELDRALELLDRLIQVAPENGDYRQNRARVAAARGAARPSSEP